jgi:hypothetical protein
MSQYYDTLRVTPSDDGHVVTVEMHRPEALNAMNTAMGRELLHCFENFLGQTDTGSDPDWGRGKGLLRRRGFERASGDER